MAISDTLSAAAEEIKDYLHNQPSMYSEVRQKIDALLLEMERVRIVLDAPPFNDPTGPWASVHAALEAAFTPRG